MIKSLHRASNSPLKSADSKSNKFAPGELSHIATQGAFWNVFFAVANKVITILGQFALAWFLVPKEMGIANMAQATAAFTAVLSVGGLGDVLLQRRKFEQEAGQAFWLSVGFSTMTALVICGMALASPFIGKPEIKNLLWILALTTLIGAPATVMSASLKIRLDFKGLALSQFLGGFLFTTLAVFFAWLGWGPYALIIPTIPRILGIMLILGLRGGTFKFIKPIWLKLLELAKPTLSLSLSGLFSGLQMQAPIFICGMVLGAENTGFFSWGWLVAGQVVYLLAVNLREVLLPTFTHIGGDLGRMTRAALRAAHTITAFLCVTCGAQALLAEPLIKLFLPAKWYPAIPLVIIFSLGLISQGLWVSGSALLNACDRYRTLLTMSAIQMILNSVFTLVGSLVGNVLGAVIGCAIATFAGGIIYIQLMNKDKTEPYWTFWIKPTFWTLLLWLGCFLVAWKHVLEMQLLAAVLFVILDGWVWWRSDKGGLKSVAEKIYQKIRVVIKTVEGKIDSIF